MYYKTFYNLHLWILYFSLQAVSRHSCMELLNVHESEIQSAISENNLEEADLKPKIRRLDRINKLLAHRPWAIKRHHINIHFPSNQHFKFDSFLYVSCSISSDNILKRCIEEVLWNSIYLNTTLKSDWWMIFNDRLINKGVVFYVLWTITS